MLILKIKYCDQIFNENLEIFRLSICDLQRAFILSVESFNFMNWVNSQQRRSFAYLTYTFAVAEEANGATNVTITQISVIWIVLPSVPMTKSLPQLPTFFDTRFQHTLQCVYFVTWRRKPHSFCFPPLLIFRFFRLPLRRFNQTLNYRSMEIKI